jgi:predicted small lipoprotein YifL
MTMPTTFRSLFLPLALLAGFSLALSGCGRKGDLDVPGAQPVKQTDPSVKVKPKVEERPFILDPIL